jgi:MoxR-like ATPase
LPEASFVFLDELLNANSAILNSLLMVLNERVFRRGREMRKLPTLMVVGASNRLPEDETLGALFDRFLLRVQCDNVAQEQLQEVLSAGWKLDLEAGGQSPALSVEDILILQSLLKQADFVRVRPAYLELIHRLRHAGVAISDRRAVKLQRLLAASALLCGRTVVEQTDLWILRYIWDTQEQQEVIATIVQEAVEAGTDSDHERHARSHRDSAPDPEELARDLDRLALRAEQENLDAVSRTYLRDQLGVLDSRCQWVADGQQRTFLETRVAGLWEKLGRPR